MLSKRLIAMIMLSLLSVSVLAGVFRIQYAGALPSSERLDNLIITTADLEAAASRLAQWKNSCGIPSRVLDVEWINSTFIGVDEPERIRNCIRDFHSNFQTKYVTIFGDTDKVPIRYVHVPDTVEDEIPTDLYYSDLDYSWDDNQDGLYGDLGNDTVNGMPDVYVGRIPASYTNTAEDVVTKIIDYKQDFNVSEDWVKGVVLTAGDSDQDITTNMSEYISGVMWDRNLVKLYHSAGNLTNSALSSQINNGCLFLNFMGHSGGGLFEYLRLLPECWILGPHPWNPFDYEKFTYQDALATTNGRRLPVVVTMSCSSANVDWTGLLGGECLGEYFVMNPNGGSIAYFGSTGIAWGNTMYGFMPEMNRRVYEAFIDGYDTLGQMWGISISRYLTTHGLYSKYGDAGYLDEKTAMEFILLGDPTLRIYDGPRTLNVPEDYTTIQSAINDAYEGDTVFVRNGTYHEHVVVNKRISLVGEDRDSVIIDGNGTGTVIQAGTDSVEIAGFTIRNSGSDFLDSGVWIVSGHGNCTITGNNIVHTWAGITLIGTSDINNVSKNNISNNTNGFFLWTAHQNRIFENNVSYNDAGFAFDEASDNMIFHNNVVGNTQFFGVWTPDRPYINFVDDGYPSGGNFWSGIEMIDLYSGPYQNESGPDGIRDTPADFGMFVGTDQYPLMNPWTPPDAAALNISSSKTIVGEGFSTNVTVSVENQGGKIEELNASFYANETFIGYQTFMLTSNNSIIYSSEWDLTSLAKGNHSLSVRIAPLEGETDLNDNSLNDSWIFITIRGDLNGDKTVDIYDAILLGGCYNSHPASPNWNPNIDINNDNIIDIYDAILLANNYGKSWT